MGLVYQALYKGAYIVGAAVGLRAAAFFLTSFSYYSSITNTYHSGRQCKDRFILVLMFEWSLYFRPEWDEKREEKGKYPRLTMNYQVQ